MKNINYLAIALSIILSSVSLAAEETWLCIEDADQSVYPLKLSGSEISFQFDADTSPWIFDIQTVAENGVMFATQPLETTNRAKQGVCLLCTDAAILIFDPVRGKRTYYSHGIGFENGEVTERSWWSIHQSTRAF